MKILVVTPYYAPDLGPSAPMFTMLSEDLIARGHAVTVLCAVPHFPSGQVAREYRQGLWQWSEQNGVQVCRVYVPSGNRANLLHRLWSFLVYQLLVTLAGLRLQYEVALVTNPAIETGLPFAILCWLRRKPCVYAVWDVYPEAGIHLGIFRNKAVISVVRNLEDFCLHRSNLVHILSKDFIPALQAHDVPTSKQLVIEPWVDTDFVCPLPRCNSFSAEFGLNNYFTVLYSGNLGFSQALDNILLAAQMLSSHPDVLFVIVGDGVRRENLLAMAQELHLANVKFIPFQPRERLPEVLASADLALVSLQSGSGNDSLPSKTFPILASGRPILAVVEDGSALSRLVQQTHAGECVFPADPEALAGAVLSLKAVPEKRTQMGQNGRAYALLKHSRGSASDQFVRSFLHVTRTMQ